MVESHCGRWLGHPEYTAVKCVDTPSFAGQLADRARVAQIRNFLEACTNGVDAFLVVIKVTHYRYVKTLFDFLHFLFLDYKRACERL